MNPFNLKCLGMPLALCLLSFGAAATSRSMAELTPLATIKLGETADWVAVSVDAVWVASSGPFAVHRIDPNDNRLLASVKLPGEPCAGLAIGAGSLWVPMCTTPASLAKVNLATNKLTSIFAVGPAGAESGIAYGAKSIWLIVSKLGDLARIDPATGAVLDTFRVPAGSFNPAFKDGTLWVTRADGAELTGIDAATGKTIASVVTGLHPRFLTVGLGAIWTLNQGDGTMTRIDARNHDTTAIALATPGHGGDIAFHDGYVWTTMPKVPLSLIDAGASKLLCQWAGAGGDSLGLGHDALWLTDYHAGTVSRFSVKDVLRHCI